MPPSTPAEVATVGLTALLYSFVVAVVLFKGQTQRLLNTHWEIKPGAQHTAVAGVSRVELRM